MPKNLPDAESFVTVLTYFVVIWFQKPNLKQQASVQIFPLRSPQSLRERLSHSLLPPYMKSVTVQMKMSLDTQAVTKNPVGQAPETVPPDFLETLPPEFLETVPPEFLETLPPEFVETVSPDFLETIPPGFLETVPLEFLVLSMFSAHFPQVPLMLKMIFRMMMFLSPDTSHQ